MKTLKNILESSVLDNAISEASLLDIDNTLSVTSDDIRKEDVKKFIEENYKDVKFTISNTPNKDGKFEVSSVEDVILKNYKLQYLTNDDFVWKKVNGDFRCSFSSIVSLKGSPELVWGSFSCSGCRKLTSLEGAPKETYENFMCEECEKLTSLKGAPEKVGENFHCSNCKNLISLKGAPKKVGGSFWCKNCKVAFKYEDVMKVSAVRNEVWNY